MKHAVQLHCTVIRSKSWKEITVSKKIKRNQREINRGKVKRIARALHCMVLIAPAKYRCAQLNVDTYGLNKVAGLRGTHEYSRGMIEPMFPRHLDTFLPWYSSVRHDCACGIVYMTAWEEVRVFPWKRAYWEFRLNGTRVRLIDRLSF